MIRGAREARSRPVKPTPKHAPLAKRNTSSAKINPLAHDLATRPILASQDDGTRSQESESAAGLPGPLARTGGGDGPGDEPTPHNVQMKLTVGPPNDPLEQEADRTAARASGQDIHAVPGATPIVSRASFQSGSGQAVNASLDGRIRAPNGGRPLPEPVRNDMETMFNADFSAVRVHDGEQDRADAESFGARAFTHKHDIWLGRNGSVQDRGLLAHELTHVIQQGTDVRRKTTDQIDPEPDAVGEHEPQATVTTSETPDIQAAWYNFSIPFTDYEFDPSISGIKTAAGVVKDAAVDSAVWVKDQVVAGFEWVYERVKDLVMAGINWLEAKYTAIKEFAKSSFDTINNGLKALLQRVTSPAELLTNAVRLMNGGLLATAWNLLKSGVTLVWRGIKTTIDGVLSIGTGLWDAVSGFVSRRFDSLDGIFDSWAFGMLPKSVQSVARGLYRRVRVLWEEIRDFITGLLRRLREYADHVLGAIEEFANKVISFGIDAVISAVRSIAEAWEFVKTVAADPIGYIRPHTDKLAAQLDTEAPPKALAFGNEKLQENVRRAPTGGGPDTVVQRQPEPDKPTRSVAGWDDVKEGFSKAIHAAWAQLNIRQMLLDTILNLLWPIGPIADEFAKLWSTDWANAAASFFAPRWPFGSWADFAGFWHDVWSNILVVLDFPLALIRRLINVLMLLTGWFTIIMIVLGAVAGGALAGPPGLLAGALLGLEIASGVGLVLLKLYLLAEGASFVKSAIDLFTARQTQPEKDRDYMQMAGSSLGIAVALILLGILWLVSALIDGLIAIIKGSKAPSAVTMPAGEGTPPTAAPVKAEPKTGAPEPAKSAEQVKPGEALKVEPPKEPAPTAEEAKPSAPKPAEPVEPVPGTSATFKVRLSALKATKPTRLFLVKNKALWHWKLYVELPNGETAVWCEINIRFRGSPDLNLDTKAAKVLGTSKTVTLKAEGFKWTAKALEMMIETYKAEFGHAPKNLGGWLAKDNLLNFQTEFANIRAANPGLSTQEAAQAAVKAISFGKARVALGYEHFHVTILKTGKVPKVTLPDGTTPTVPTMVRVEAGTSPIELGKIPPLVPQIEGEGESAGEEDEEE
jgi:hypothetical protein